MSALDIFDQLGGPPPTTEQKIKRDHLGRYMLPDPATGEIKPWKRVTSFADTLANRRGLEKWTLRNVTYGIGQRKDLQHLAASCKPTDHDQLDEIIGKAQAFSRSDAGANSGTAVHHITERIDAGEQVHIADDDLRADVEAYVTQMRAAQIRVARDAGTEDPWIERVLLVPELGLAGTCDRLLLRDDWPLPRIGDLKTCKDARKAMDSIPLQLAVYANAPYWVELELDGTVRAIHPMPTVDRERALVMHVPLGRATCQLIEVDIAAGWQAVQLAAEVEAWRKRNDLCVIITAPAPAPRGIGEADDRQAAGDTDRSASPSEPTPAAAPQLVPPPAEPFDQVALSMRVAQVIAEAARHPVGADITPAASDRVRWLRDRLVAIIEAGHEQLLAHCWPDNAPTVKQGGLTNRHVDQIANVCTAIEALLELPFVAEDPLKIVERMARALKPKPRPNVTEPAEDDLYGQEGRRVLGAFDEDERKAIARCAFNSDDPYLPVTAERLERLEAVATQAASHNGAVILGYGPDGPVVQAAPGAADRMAEACDQGGGASKAAALQRAKNLADQIGLPRPRSLAKAAEQPLLAALVAAGKGEAMPTTDTTANSETSNQ